MKLLCALISAMDVSKLRTKCYGEINTRIITQDFESSDPLGITVGHNGNLYVAYSSMIRCLTPNGEFVHAFGSDHLVTPVDICFDPITHRLFVVDRAWAKIVVFESNDDFVNSFGFDHLESPGCITMCPLGLIYVTDSNKDCVQIFNRDGDFIGSLGEGKMRHPSCVTIMPDGNLLVGEIGHNALSIWSPNGRLIREIGEDDWDAPYSLLIRDDTIFVIGDYNNPVLRSMTFTGKLIQEINLPYLVTGIAADSGGNIFISCKNKKIYIIR